MNSAKHLVRAVFFFFVGCIPSILFSQTVSRSMKRLPDTGQTMSYTQTPGEDADFTVDFPFFIETGGNSVIDTVTGLMWQKADGGEMTYERAVIYCDTLTLDGYSDWRLPNTHESFSILNHQYSNPALDKSVFDTTAAEYWWTSDRQVNDQSKVWVTNSGGGVGNHPKSETMSAGGSKRFHVRAVREPIASKLLFYHYSINDDGTITDSLTDRVWQQFPESDTMTWEEALVTADTLSVGGYTDWRLPNIKELQSLSDNNLINPSLDTNYFRVSAMQRFWSSTTLPNQTMKAWYLDTRFGITTYESKIRKLNILYVRSNNTKTVTRDNRLPEQILVYPNPFSSYIISPLLSDKDYEIVNSLGRVVYVGNNLNHDNLAHLVPGIYYLRVRDSGNTMIKLVKY